VLRNILSDLLDIISIVGVDIDVVKKSLKSVHKNFEDAIQISSASSVKNIDCIVTRNIKDFKLSEIPVFSPEHLWKLIKDN
jgi:tRNA A-37 threonylcarbamoyl transferase component Bud32